MDVRLDLNELDMVREVVQQSHDAAVHEIHHADVRDYRKSLQARAEQLESILRKLDAAWRSERP